MTDKTDTHRGSDEAPGRKLKQAADLTREVMDDTLSSARERLQDAAELARDRADKVGDAARERYAKFSETARERYAELAEQAQARYRRARKSVDELTGNVNDYVRDNPGKAILMAAGVGFVIGLLVRGIGRRDS